MAYRPSYGQVDRAYGMRMATMAPDEDGPVLMVNLMRYRERAAYADGTDGGVSGREADDRYAPVEVLADIGATVVLFGDVVAQPVGATPRWDRVGCVRYPTRRSFVEMQSRTDFRDQHRHKEAGMAETIVMGCQPEGGPAGPGETARDRGRFVLVEVSRQAAPEGPGSSGDAGDRFPYRVEGTIVGDGRTWETVRFTRFDTEEAAVAAATAASGTGPDDDRYGIVVAARIDRL